MPGGVAGEVDGLVDGELRGWIANFDRPATAETIWCVGGSGQGVAVRPTFRHEDACAAFGVDYIRGFSVPRDLLGGLGQVVSVQDDAGRPLRHGSSVSIGTEPSASAHGNGRQWLFMHIPKTAGTSLRRALLRSVPPGEALMVYPNWDLGVTYEECLALPAPQLHRFRWIYGHYKTGLHRRASSGARYLTFLREPLARLRSNVAHHAAAGTAFSVGGVPVGPASFINDGLGEEFDNLITRMIAGVTPDQVGPGALGECHVEMAIDNIRRHFAFVGRQECARADSETLQGRAGLHVTVPELANVTPSRLRYDAGQMDAIDWPAITHRNRFDVLLHQQLLDLNLTSRFLD